MRSRGRKIGRGEGETIGMVWFSSAVREARAACGMGVAVAMAGEGLAMARARGRMGKRRRGAYRGR